MLQKLQSTTLLELNSLKHWRIRSEGICTHSATYII